MNRSKLTRSPASGNVERFSSPWTIGSPAAEEFCNTIWGIADQICEAPGDRQGVEGASPL